MWTSKSEFERVTTSLREFGRVKACLGEFGRVNSPQISGRTPGFSDFSTFFHFALSPRIHSFPDFPLVACMRPRTPGIPSPTLSICLSHTHTQSYTRKQGQGNNSQPPSYQHPSSQQNQPPQQHQQHQVYVSASRNEFVRVGAKLGAWSESGRVGASLRESERVYASWSEFKRVRASLGDLEGVRTSWSE